MSNDFKLGRLMTPESAKASLVTAHAGMTGIEIAEHATCLAMVVASCDEAQAAQFQLLEKALFHNASLTVLARNTAIVLRQIASLQASHRKAEARRVLHSLIAATQATLDVEPPSLVNLKPVRVEEAWPDIFNPRGTLHDD